MLSLPGDSPVYSSADEITTSSILCANIAARFCLAAVAAAASEPTALRLRPETGDTEAAAAVHVVIDISTSGICQQIVPFAMRSPTQAREPAVVALARRSTARQADMYVSLADHTYVYKRVAHVAGTVLVLAI